MIGSSDLLVVWLPIRTHLKTQN